MMSTFGPKGLTRFQWCALIKKTGLKILEIYEYTTVLNDPITIAVPKMCG